MAREKQKGQAIILVVVALGIFMFGAIGLAVDGAQMYAHHQMAQAAADAAAQAGIMSIYDATNVGTNAFGVPPSPGSFNCTTTDGRTPCAYARLNGFGASTDDTVTVDFPTSVSGVSGVSPTTLDPVNIIKVTVQRNVRTSFIRMVGFGASSTIRATATAAIMVQNSPIPIIVTHPTLSGSFSTNGGTGGTSDTLKICGGPQRSIQVNSSSASAASFAGGGNINLSHAGPLVGPADSDGCTGTGGDFGIWGGPSSKPTNINTGTTGYYLQPASPIRDPLWDVPAPTAPTANGVTTVISPTDTTRYGCPAGQSCTLYQPGLYNSTKGITVKNDIALFAPGVYYVSQGGFNLQSNSQAQMATGFANDPATGAGMLVYNTGSGSGDIFNFTSNAGSKGPITLLGSDPAGTYKGILFFQDRSSVAHTGSGSHSVQGGGAITLTGTIYVTNTLAIMNGDSTHYQGLNIQGNAGSTTTITGEIIAGALSVGGTAGIKMTLATLSQPPVRYVALVR